jgi:hypothetical protein
VVDIVEESQVGATVPGFVEAVAEDAMEVALEMGHKVDL